MSITELREKLHEIIDRADEKYLRAIYVLLGKEINSGYEYDEATLQQLYERREEYLGGKDESYTPEEALEMIYKSKK